MGSSEATGYEEFESIGLAGITESLQEAVDVLDVSTTFLIAFERASALQRDGSASPGAFDFSRYCQFAREMQDIDDKPLSVWHHDRACERMADRMVIASRDRFSSVRLLRRRPSSSAAHAIGPRPWVCPGTWGKDSPWSGEPHV